MKTAETISTATNQHHNSNGSQSFFNKEGGSTFFSDTQAEIQSQPFFDHPHAIVDTGSHMIQTRPDRNAIPDRETETPVSDSIDGINGSVETISIQTKCAECAEEEEVQTQVEQEERQDEAPEIQEKPIFESEGEETEGDIQTKQLGDLKVGEPDDEYEQEADAVADNVVQMLEQPEPEVKEEEEEVMTQEAEEEIQSKPDIESVVSEEPLQTKVENEAAIPSGESVDIGTDHSPIAEPVPSPAPITLQAKCEECEQEEKEEIQEQPELQKKPIFDSDADPPEDDDPDIQRRAKEIEKTEYPILFKRMPNVQRSSGSSSESSLRENIVKEAQKMVGKIEARKDDGSGRRVGADHLLDIFHLAAKDEWPDEVIENVRYTQESKEFPHWCGIFSVYAIKKAGIDLGYWQVGKGVSAFGTLASTENPKPGDIGYFTEKQHHCIIKAVNGDTIESIDGNSGPFSEVKERTRPRDQFHAFFTPFTGSEKIIQKKAESASDEASPSLQDKLSTKSGTGSPLDANTKGQMESAMGADFSNVRVHTDSDSVEMNQSLHAQAFTHGSDIYFNEGKYQPETSSGKHLLAHELTHTVQQGASVQTQKQNSIPDVQKNGGTNESLEERRTSADNVYDALSGYTSSTDSATIFNELKNLNKDSIDTIMLMVAQKNDSTVPEVIEWMEEDMVTSDWKTLLEHFISMGINHIEKAVAIAVYERLSGYTSEDDSSDILSFLAGESPLNASQLTIVLNELENEAEENADETADWLFSDLTSVHAHRLSLQFFASGSIKAINYAAYWIASKIEDLLAGYTSIGDSESIVDNFERVPAPLRSYVLYKLDDITQERWEQTAADALMEDMQQEDYESLRTLMPGLLPVYNIEKSFLEGLWDKITTGFDYVVSFLEYAVCGIAGFIWGLFTVVLDIVYAVGDIIIAIGDLIGGFLYLVTGGRVGRESADRIQQFFSALGQFFGAPGESISMLWDEMMLEFDLIEGPFKECQQAFFWASRVTNFIVNIILILWGGYGAAKLAMKGIESLTLLARSGQLIAALRALPGRLWTAIKGMPGAVGRGIASGTSRIVRLLRAPMQTINEVRTTVSIIRLAAAEEGYFMMLRRQAGRIIGDEAQFWRERREFWRQRADILDEDLAHTEGKLVGAVETSVDDPARAEQIIDETDELAGAAKTETDDVLDDIKGTAREPNMSQPEINVPAAWAEGSTARPPMLSTVIDRLRQNNISDDVIEAIIARAHAHGQSSAPAFFGDMNRFLIRAGRDVVEDDVMRIIIDAMTNDNYFAEARFLMERVASGNVGQDINAIVRTFTFEDIAMLRQRFADTPDVDLVNDLNNILGRVDGSRNDILALLDEVGEPELERFKSALDRLGDGRYTPEEVRESFAFASRLEQAMATDAEAVARTVWGDAYRGMDPDGKVRVAESLTRDRAGDLASAHIRARRREIAASILRGENGTEIDMVNFEVIRNVIRNSDLPTIVKNDIIGELWAFTKVRRYENLGYVVIREVRINVLDADGNPTGEYSMLDAVLKKEGEILYKEFKSSPTAGTTDPQDLVYPLLERGETSRLSPSGPNAERAFGGPDMPDFRGGEVSIERPTLQ